MIVSLYNSHRVEFSLDLIISAVNYIPFGYNLLTPWLVCLQRGCDSSHYHDIITISLMIIFNSILAGGISGKF